MPPLNKFTTKAKNAVRKAHEIGIERGQNTISPVHLMIAILSLDQDNLVIAALDNLKIDYILMLDHAIELVEGQEQGDTVTQSYQMYLTPELIDVLNESEKISKDMQEEFIGLEHLFMSILINSTRDIEELLSKFKIDRRDFLNTIFKLREKKGEIENKKVFKYLRKYGKNLTNSAKQNKIDPLIGREKEIERMIQIISRRKKNNPILIGEAGVGKTAIVEGLAQKIIDGNVPDFLKDINIYSIDLSLLIAGTKFRGEFEERLKGILKDILDSDKKSILFIDEIHMIVGAGGSSDGSMDASNILKPALARGEIVLIGATTLDEHRNNIEKDAALNRRFQSISVREPGEKETFKILQGLKSKYESYHGIKITDEAIRAAVELSSRYITDRFLPDKAIDLIDEASSLARIKSGSLPKDLKEIENKLIHLEIKKRVLEREGKNKKMISSVCENINLLEKEKERIDKKWNKEKKISQKIHKMKNSLDDLKQEAGILESEKKIDELLDLQSLKIEALELALHKEEAKLLRIQQKDHILCREIDRGQIEMVVSDLTGVPISKMTEDDLSSLLDLNKKIEAEIIGQDKVVDKIVMAIKRARIGISDPQRPIASFMFLGPTGVGKTELAKTIAKHIFNHKNSLIKVDMSELMESHSVSKLIGSPPGYVGYDEGGSLTEKVRRNPYAVILFDEIEKANIDVLNILLQILDEGILTDSKGLEVNFKNTIIILTSNIGAKFVSEDKKTIGFNFKEINGDNENKKKRNDKVRDNISSITKKYFSAEFLNRLDDIVIFDSLSQKQIIKIFEIEFENIRQRLLKKDIRVTMDPEIFKEVLIDNYNYEFGARPVKKILESKILNPLSNQILSSKIQKGDFAIRLEKGKIKIQPIISVVKSKKAVKKKEKV